MRSASDQKLTVVLVGGGNIVAGKEVMMLSLARGLRHAGCRAVFITSVWGGKGEFVARLKAEGFEYYRVRLGFISKTLSWKPIVWTINQLVHWPALVVGYLNAVKASAPHTVIHTNWHHALLLMPLLDRRRDLYWSHEIVPTRRHYAWIFRAIAKRVSRVVCVSHAVARSMERAGVPPSKLVVIHNGITFDAAIPPPRTDLPLCLGIVGQIGPWKGHDDILDALALLPRDCATLRIFGSGQDDYVTALKQKAEALGIADRIEWRGFVSDQTAIYRNIDVCLVPSRIDEAFPTAALEASLFGRPVICSPRGGLTEIVEDKKTGFVVETERPGNMADAIKSLCRDLSLVFRFGAEGRKRTEAEFSFTGFTNRFVDLIKEDEK